jgi:hypothetical protein
MESDYELWAAWMRCVASSLYLEKKFNVSGKEIAENLDGLEQVKDRGDMLKWCSRTYDRYHKLRNNVETLDSIEEVKLYLKEKNAHLGNLLSLYDDIIVIS